MNKPRKHIPIFGPIIKLTRWHQLVGYSFNLGAKALFLLLFLFNLAGLGIAQQIDLQSNRDSVEIGDIIQLQVVIQAPEDLRINGPGLNGLAESEFWEPRTTPRFNRNESNFSEEMSIQVFLDSGQLTIPGVQYEVINDDETFTLVSPPIQIQVRSAIAPTEVPSDLRSIIKEKNNISDYWPWVVGLLVAGLAVWFIIYLRKNRQKLLKKADKPKLIQPKQEALDAFEKLKIHQLWTHEPKEFQYQISLILRRYMDRALGIKTLEETTVHILDQFDEQRWGVKDKLLLAKLLNDSDLVKFSKVTFSEETHRGSLEAAINWVKTIERKR